MSLVYFCLSRFRSIEFIFAWNWFGFKFNSVEHLNFVLFCLVWIWDWLKFDLFWISFSVNFLFKLYSVYFEFGSFWFFFFFFWICFDLIWLNLILVRFECSLFRIWSDLNFDQFEFSSSDFDSVSLPFYPNFCFYLKSVYYSRIQRRNR